MASKDPAVQQANAALAPVLAELQRQIAQTQQQTSDQQARITQGAQGLAQTVAPIGNEIQDAYNKAGAAQAGYAAGFSGSFRSASEAAQNELNSILSKTGPAGGPQVQGAGSAGANVLYGLGGYIPASTLAREGAGFRSAAEGLSALALGRGQEQSFQAGREGRDRISQLDALLRQEKAKLPGLVQERRDSLAKAKLEAQEFAFDKASKQRAAAVNEALARSTIGDREFDQALSKAKFVESSKTNRARVKNESARVANERARIRLQSNRDSFNRLLGRAKLDLDAEKVEIAAKRETRMKQSPKKGGFTAKQKQDLSQIAFDTAADDFDAGTKPVETLRDLIAAGVPFSLAIRAIQRFGRGKDADQFWKATLGWTKKK